MQTAEIIGSLGRDAELKQTKNGGAFAKLAIAVNSGYGENKSTTWWDVAYFGNRAEKVAPYLTKGTKVFVSGDFSLNSYTTNAGEQRITPSIRADRIELLSSKNEVGSQPPREKPVSRPQPEPQSAEFNDDIPF
jgi:single-strand DNA-binding protein